MQLQARRVFRLSLTIALALAGAYALQLPLPFIAPLFALLFTAPPAPPMGPKNLLGLILTVLLTLGVGLLLIPVLTKYPVSAILTVAVGLYFSNYLALSMGKGLLGTLLIIGFTLISAAGTVDYLLAVSVIKALVLGIGLAIVCQWAVYPWFPENDVAATKSKPKATGSADSNWVAMRATLIVLPAYLLTLTNPSVYLPIIMKSVSLGQQGSLISARDAGRELLGSTFMGGYFAILFWFVLGLATNLWMFFLWMLIFGVYFASKIYRISPSRYNSSFWLNVTVTMLILLGPAVEDSATGKDVYAAFAVRMSLFVAVTLYAWMAVYTLEHLRSRHRHRSDSTTLEAEPNKS